MLPHCSLGGDTPLPEGSEGDIAVVVCYAEGKKSTTLMSNHLQQWDLSFTEALRFAMKNLKALTKGEASKKPAERWSVHPSGCATTQWLDGSDSVRLALLPSIAATRKRAEGDEGGTVAIFASNHIALSAGSKNPVGLCYAGDVANLQVVINEVICATPWRLVKALAGTAESHPLRQACSGPKADASTAGGTPGRVWKWIPYVPGPDEFSVPRDQNEVDAILAACEAIQNGSKMKMPVFGSVKTPEEVEKEKCERALKLKDTGGQCFVAEDFNGALRHYAAALEVGGLSNGDMAKVHANIAACLLKLGGEERVAKALRAAVEAYTLDPAYAKGYFRAAQALQILGETDAAAEAQAKADELIAAEKAAKEIKQHALRQKRAAKEARAAKLAAEKATAAYNEVGLGSCECCPDIAGPELLSNFAHVEGADEEYPDAD